MPNDAPEPRGTEYSRGRKPGISCTLNLQKNSQGNDIPRTIYMGCRMDPEEEGLLNEGVRGGTLPDAESIPGF
jgi:hypothetical protein